MYFRDKTDNEIGGFGVTKAGDLLFIEDFQTVRQNVTAISIKFDDVSVGDFFDDQVDSGRRPEQFARLWIHSHPGDSAEPSLNDERTFQRVFGNCDWAVLFVIARDNSTYARLSFNVGPGGRILIPVEVDYDCHFGPSDHASWDEEYRDNVEIEDILSRSAAGVAGDDKNQRDSSTFPSDFIEQLENMEPAERQLVIDELADKPEFYDGDSEDMSYEY